MLGLCLSAATVSAAPTVDSVATIPANPEPTATIKVIAELSGDIESVNVRISGCDSEGCYDFYPEGGGAFELTLNVETGKYETEEFTLKNSKPSIDHLQYAFTVNDGVEDHTILVDADGNDLKTYLDLSGDNGGSNGGGGDNDSPGFELALFLTAIIIGVIILRKKR